MSTKIIHNEECQVIEGYERYHISKSGRVYRTKALNAKDKIKLNEGATYLKEMTVSFHNRKSFIRQGFCSLTANDGSFKNLPVAPLVINAFSDLPKRYNGRKNKIEYLDGNKKNLHIDNIVISNKKPGNTKLLKAQVKDIKKQILKGVTLKDLSKQYGVSDMQINRIKTGENWGNGKRKILAPEAPFQIDDGKIRRFVSLFNREEIDPKIRKQFYIKRNPDKPTDNQITGILKGYKLTHKHVNITRARVLVDMLNDYFFNNQGKEVKKEPVFNEFYKSFENE